MAGVMEPEKAKKTNGGFIKTLQRRLDPGAKESERERERGELRE